MIRGGALSLENAEHNLVFAHQKFSCLEEKEVTTTKKMCNDNDDERKLIGKDRHDDGKPAGSLKKFCRKSFQ
jgi:hypothetical protein